MTGPVRPAPAGSAAISESRLAGGSADRPSSRLPDELLESAVSRPTGATAAVAPPPPGADGAPSTAAAPPAAAAMAIYIYIGVVSSLADPAVCFGGGQPGEVTEARVPQNLGFGPLFFGEWPKITYKKKKKTKKARLQVPGLSWKSMVSPVGPRFVLRGCDCFAGLWFVMRRSGSSCGVLIRPART